MNGLLLGGFLLGDQLLLSPQFLRLAVGANLFQVSFGDAEALVHAAGEQRCHLGFAEAGGIKCRLLHTVGHDGGGMALLYRHGLLSSPQHGAAGVDVHHAGARLLGHGHHRVIQRHLHIPRCGRHAA